MRQTANICRTPYVIPAPRSLRRCRRGACVTLKKEARQANTRLRSMHLLGLAVAFTSVVFAQADPLAVPAQRWAADAARNELKVLEYDGTYLRYRMHVVDAKGDVVRDVIESRDGPVARLILKGRRPLTADEDAAERERLQEMVDSPDAYARHVKNEQAGKKQARQVIEALPQAMLFTYAPGQPQREHHALGEAAEVVVDYKPNPNWTSPSLASEALTGMEGRAWIDPATHTVTRLEARVFRSVNIGLGLLAHVYPGGHAEFDQARISGDRWIFTHFVEHATVRALMLKTIKQDTEVQASNFSPVPGMNYRDAIRLLLGTPPAPY